MRFLSVCSGIEAASVAWTPLGWEAVAFSEIEPFPCTLLAHHYPHVPNRGDMTKYQEWPDATFDLLCGGTPCQSFSVAGLRKGLDDPRGNLMLTFGAIAARYRPRWLVWENVPGVLSSNGGRDFGSFLGMLGQLGYGFAYRVLDAQYFGVAQRRRRVFVVGCLGDWRSAAAVLFERHSMQGHPAPSRNAGKAAPTIPSRSTGGGGLGTDFDCDGGLIAGTLNANGKAAGSATQQDAEAGLLVSMCLTRGGQQRLDAESETLIPTIGGVFDVAHSLRGEGFDASEDGTGRGTPLVPVAYAATDYESGAFDQVDQAAPLTTSADRTRAAPIVAFSAKDHGADAAEDLSPTLRAGGHSDSHANAGVMPAIAFVERGRADGRALECQEDLAYAQQARSGGGATDRFQVMTPVMQVRRLTPRECERLQGFQDDYTLIPHRGKPAADGPRYKALGNSWAVPVVRWIGQRIDQVEAIAELRKVA